MFSSKSAGEVDYSASDFAQLQKELAETKERFNDAVQDLRNERAASKMDRLELQRLKAQKSLTELAYPMPQGNKTGLILASLVRFLPRLRHNLLDRPTDRHHQHHLVSYPLASA